MEYQFTKDNFNDEVINSDQPVLIDFYADWCGPCRKMSKVVTKVADKYDGRVKVGKINIEEQPELTEKYNVMMIPNFVFIKDGQIFDRMMGVQPKLLIEDKLKRMLK